MPFSKLKAFSRRRLARAGVGILVLAGAAFAQYTLTHLPWPVDLVTIKELSPATAGAREELIIEGPVVTAEEGTLFAHVGNLNETVDVSFDQARLDAPTVAMFESYGFGLNPPSTPAQVKYHSQESPPSSDEPCRTVVELRTTSQMPAEISFSQLDAPVSNRDRYLQMKSRGAELTAHLQTDPSSDSNRGPGCQKLLKVGDWRLSLTINPVTTVVTDDSSVRFYFRPRTSDAKLWTETQGFVPLVLGKPEENLTAPPFQARAVSIKSLVRGGSEIARVSARSADDGSLLAINALSVGPEQIQVSIAGKGHVKINGETVTVNFLKPILETPVLLALFVLANGALLALVGRLVFKAPQTPSSPAEA